MCTPHNSLTHEPRTTKIGMKHLGPYLTPSAKFGTDRLMGAKAAKILFHKDFGLPSHFFDQATDQTAEPI
jgi:hypothetical protein